MKTYVLVTIITVYFLITKFTVFLGLLLQKNSNTVLLCSHFLSFSIIPSLPVSWKLSLSFRFSHRNNAHIFLLSCNPSTAQINVIFDNLVLLSTFFLMISVSEVYGKNGAAGITFQLFLILPNVKYKCHKSWLHSYTVGFYRPEMEYGYLDFPHIHHMWLLLLVWKVSYFRSLQTKMEIDLPASDVIKVY